MWVEEEAVLEDVLETYHQQQNTMHIFNIDDYHSIHSYRRPKLASLHNVHHIATCITKRIENYPPIPATYNGVSFFNPLNIDASLINKYLIEKYMDHLDML
ncbi:28642_t:CDS:2 [Dentiscutata erythropus]|uniref:28642_t:CDS:1 n=1 Tax=Dentiscutata erythropus TaxID=1348616 RepID=A0A9N9B0E1_9GLOM|nr:28642_t:CDS:2 [Dentiscutata erythropus]